MENHLLRRFPRLFPSSFTSCQSKKDADIILNTNNTQIPKQNGKSNKPFSRIHTYSHKLIKNGKSMSDVDQRVHGNSYLKMKNCSSSYSGLFSSEESGTFCSFSTGSAESFGRLRLAENKNSLGRCSSEVSVRSIGSIFAELTQKSQIVQCENIAFSPFSKKVSKTNDEFEPKSWNFQEASECMGMPAEIYYKRNKKRGSTKSTNSCRRNRRKRQGRRRGEKGDIGLCSIVEKSSRDPYGDFRTSIVEMMMENQIFGAQDLEKLLHCLLSLNSSCYHDVIVQVFSEICQTLYVE